MVLAAGLSRRMGPGNKLLLEVDGVPMVRRVVEAALAGGLDPVVVVVDAAGADVRASLDGLPVAYAENDRPTDGLSSSLALGVGALGGTARTSGAEAPDAAVVLLGDMPWVRADDVRTLAAAYDPATGHEICVPTYDGRRGNPVLWSRRFFQEMTELSGDVGARPLLTLHDGHVREVAVGHCGVLRDVDTREALRRAFGG